MPQTECVIPAPSRFAASRTVGVACAREPNPKVRFLVSVEGGTEGGQPEGSAGVVRHTHEAMFAFVSRCALPWTHARDIVPRLTCYAAVARDDPLRGWWRTTISTL